VAFIAIVKKTFRLWKVSLLQPLMRHPFIRNAIMKSGIKRRLARKGESNEPQTMVGDMPADARLNANGVDSDG
jgi:hypothetical protein